MTAEQAGAVDVTEAIVHRIRSEDAEMPGLSLTAPQAQRLLGLGSEECGPLLEHLVIRGFLRRTARGAFVRCD